MSFSRWPPRYQASPRKKVGDLVGLGRRGRGRHRRTSAVKYRAREKLLQDHTLMRRDSARAKMSQSLESSDRLRISVIGAGYLGTAHAVGMAQLGHDVIAMDIEEEKIARLSACELPFFEP